MCVWLFVSFVSVWPCDGLRPVQGVPRLLPDDCWDRPQPPRDPTDILSGYRNLGKKLTQLSDFQKLQNTFRMKLKGLKNTNHPIPFINRLYCTQLIVQLNRLAWCYSEGWAEPLHLKRKDLSHDMLIFQQMLYIYHMCTAEITYW